MAISSIMGLGSLNVATLIDDGIHTAAYGGLRSGLEMLDDLLIPAGLSAISNRAMANSPTLKRTTDVTRATTALTARTHALDQQLSGEKQFHQKAKADLDMEKEQHRRLQSSHHDLNAKYQKLTGDYQALDTRHTTLTQNHQQLTKVSEYRRQKVGTVSGRIVPRVGGIATKAMATLPSRSIPYLGTATSIAFTGWELHGLCQVISDMEELNSSFGNAFHDPNRVCGIPKPSAFSYFQ